MSTLGPSIDQLIQALRCLPGVGPKSAQRMTFHLLERDRSGGEYLAEMLSKALSNVKHCQRCRILSEDDICSRCSDSSRREDQLCIVEMPSDVIAIEQATHYQGQYFVLTGHLSPLDGIGPEALGIPDLIQRFDQQTVSEVILATNPTVEGQATATTSVSWQGQGVFMLPDWLMEYRWVENWNMLTVVHFLMHFLDVKPIN